MEAQAVEMAPVAKVDMRRARERTRCSVAMGAL